MKKIKNKIKKVLKDEKGIITTIYMIGIVSFLIYNLVVFLPVFFEKQNVNALTKELVEEIEYEGKIDSKTYSKASEIISRMNLNDNQVSYKITGAIRSNGKIQHRDEFKVEVSGESEVVIANFFSNPIKFTIPLKKILYGKSQVYYKSSEI